jgi:hypothetical protein
MRLITTLIAAVLTVTTADAHTPVALMYDAKVGPTTKSPCARASRV